MEVKGNLTDLKASGMSFKIKLFDVAIFSLYTCESKDIHLFQKMAVLIIIDVTLQVTRDNILFKMTRGCVKFRFYHYGSLTSPLSSY